MSEESSQPYEPPVSLLLTLGAKNTFSPETWEDYPAEYGLTAEHIPELIRLAGEKFYNRLDEDDPRIYADFHAICALGQLRHPDALAGLIMLAEAETEDDDPLEELPYAVALSGQLALPLLKQSLERCASKFYPGLTIIGCLDRLVELFPETRDDVVAVCTEQLEKASQNDASVNGHLVATLIDLKATEALPVIERAYTGKYVDEWINGDWDDVQVDLGVKEPAPDKNRRNRLNLPPDALWRATRRTMPDEYGDPFDLGMADLTPEQLKAGRNAEKNAQKKAKNKRKDASKTRRKNRKRK